MLHIHSKKRNRPEHKRLHNFVYVKYIQALVKRYNYKDENDPILLDDIDECHEWLVGQVDDDDDVGNERVFEDENDDGLPWDVVFEASGIRQPMTYTRQRTQKRKKPLSVEDVAPKTKRGQVRGCHPLEEKSK